MEVEKASSHDGAHSRNSTDPAGKLREYIRTLHTYTYGRINLRSNDERFPPDARNCSLGGGFGLALPIALTLRAKLLGCGRCQQGGEENFCRW